jgi:hypothetical protein
MGQKLYVGMHCILPAPDLILTHRLVEPDPCILQAMIQSLVTA